VVNPSVFIGEQVFGATNGSPLVVTNSQLAQGLSYSETSSTTAYTCTTTNGQVTGMTVTPAAGTYLAVYSSDFSSANAGTVVTLEYFVGGSALTISQRKFMPFTGGTLTSGSQRVMQGLNSIFAVNGSQAVQVYCQTSASTVTTAASQLDLVRIQ
jgi:hypothetical protein